MNRLLILILALLFVGTMTVDAKKRAVKKTYIYRYYLTDKNAGSHSLDKPQRFLSRKSIDRRTRQGLPIDSTDLPVPRQYVRQFSINGTEVLGTSRWQNTVLVRAADTLVLQQLGRLPIVSKWCCVYVAPDSLEQSGDIRWNVNDKFNRWDSVLNDPYGMARQQIEMLGGVRMHEAGFTGRGITIAILDGGFQNYHRIPALQHATILGTRDFVNTNAKADDDYPNGRAFHEIDHGTKVFSAIAARAPEVIIGTAPDAAFWLLRSEDHDTEQPVEEDYWTMAAEFADSVGADVINSSLGYYAYDQPLPSYRLRDLDGRTAFVSRSAALLASKGIILCNSAGNSGMGQWKKIGVPADAPNILTVGAVDGDGHLAPFSSVGPSQDGRVKPDVVAQGAPLVHDMGTSFSTPVTCGMVARLWQALPGKTALEIMELVRQSADQHEAPNNIYGYGLPNYWQAYQQGL